MLSACYSHASRSLFRQEYLTLGMFHDSCTDRFWRDLFGSIHPELQTQTYVYEIQIDDDSVKGRITGNFVCLSQNGSDINCHKGLITVHGLELPIRRKYKEEVLRRLATGI